MPLPPYLQIEPVGQCNLRCQMCPIQFRRDGPPYGEPAFMRFETYTRLIDENSALEHLHLQGLGEPMMHPRFFDLVAYAAGRGARVTTNSNLTLLKPRRAAACVTSGLDELHVSIDGATAATYERSACAATSTASSATSASSTDAKSALARATPRLHVIMVVMRQNLGELPALVRLAAMCGADVLFVQHLCHDFAESSLPAHYRPMREFVEAQTLLHEDPARIADAFDAARRIADACGIALRLPQPPGRATHRRCDWPWTGAYVSYDGFAMPCCMVATPDRANFGRIDGRTLSEVWDGAAYEDFRPRLESPAPPEICRTCAVYTGAF